MKHRISGLILLASLTPTPGLADASNSPDETFFRSFIESNCTKCHNAEKKKGKVVLEGLRVLNQDRNLYAKILEQLQAGDMPPEDEPQPDLDDYRRATEWIRGALGSQPGGAGKQAEVAVRPNEGNHLPHALLFGVDPGPCPATAADLAAFAGGLLVRITPSAQDGREQNPKDFETVCPPHRSRDQRLLGSLLGRGGDH